MIIAQLTGGLGNQFFQYAMARRLAVHHDTELLVDVSNYGPAGELRSAEFQDFKRPLGLFGYQVEARPANAEEVRALRDPFWRATWRDRLIRLLRRVAPKFLPRPSHIIEHGFRFQEEALSFPNNVYLQGYWQSPRYFADVADLIRKELRLKNDSITTSATAAVEKLRNRHGRVVSLHVRRGDLAHAKETLGQKHLTYGAPVTPEYIDRAMHEFPTDTCFLVFSDSPQDILWCRQNIRGAHLELSNAESSDWDLAAMQQCDDHIIANSTFSWWAAWLNPKAGRRVIAPRQWGHPGGAMVTDDLIPSDWEML